MALEADIVEELPFISIARSVMMSTHEYEGVRLTNQSSPKDISAIKAMEIRVDDILLAVYPKCGTHWMIEIILLLLHGGQPPSGQERLGFVLDPIELNMPNPLSDKRAGYEGVAEMKSPRLIITHLPLHLLPAQIWLKKPRIICVTRNPIDALTSGFNFLKADPEPPTFDEVFDLFLSGKSPYGACWAHQYAYWEHRNDDNFLVIRFEDMKKDAAGCIAEVAAHINCELTEDEMKNTVKYSSLAEMKATYARIEEELGPPGRFLTHAGGILPFLHTGTIGGWKALFSESQSERFQRHHDEQVKKYKIDIWK